MLVFARTKHGSDRIVKDLVAIGESAEAIHGNKSQNARQRALNGFKDGKVRVLVATDIAARGIDIDELKYVVNYDLPNEPETYVHRIGRTGRAGASGLAISFCDGEEREYLRDIKKLIKKDIPIVTEHPFPTDDMTAEAERIAAEEAKRAPRGRGRGNFSSRPNTPSRPKPASRPSASRPASSSRPSSSSSKKPGQYRKPSPNSRF